MKISQYLFYFLSLMALSGLYNGARERAREEESSKTTQLTEQENLKDVNPSDKGAYMRIVAPIVRLVVCMVVNSILIIYVARPLKETDTQGNRRDSPVMKIMPFDFFEDGNLNVIMSLFLGPVMLFLGEKFYHQQTIPTFSTFEAIIVILLQIIGGIVRSTLSHHFAYFIGEETEFFLFLLPSSIAYPLLVYLQRFDGAKEKESR